MNDELIAGEIVLLPPVILEDQMESNSQQQPQQPQPQPQFQQPQQQPTQQLPQQQAYPQQAYYFPQTQPMPNYNPQMLPQALPQSQQPQPQNLGPNWSGQYYQPAPAPSLPEAVVAPKSTPWSIPWSMIINAILFLAVLWMFFFGFPWGSDESVEEKVSSEVAVLYQMQHTAIGMELVYDDLVKHLKEQKELAPESRTIKSLADVEAFVKPRRDRSAEGAFKAMAAQLEKINGEDFDIDKAIATFSDFRDGYSKASEMLGVTVEKE